MTMTNVFISYATEDTDIAEAVHQYFQKVGFETRLPEDIEGGSDWWSQICQDILTSNFFIVILTDFSLTSPFVLDEIRTARDYGRVIIPCKYKALSWEDDVIVKLGLDRLQGVKSFSSQFDLVRELHRVIGTLPLSVEEVDSRKLYEPGRPTAQITSIWQDHNVWKGERKGMMIHVAFKIQNLKGKDGQVATYFCFSDGSYLKSYDNNRDPAGNLCVSDNFVPGYDDTVWDDFKLFMPYDILHLEKGNHSLKFFVDIWDLSVVPAVRIVRSSWNFFTFSS
jgi:TIR domain